MIYYLIVGAIAGWLAGLLAKGSGYGILGNVVIGIIGGLIGGWVFRFLGISVRDSLTGSIITAVAGAIILLWAVNLAEGKSRRRR
jgi:uncharacterized membrane protein YeaQ/YmgE (transglycosylase-associated protein family)